MSALDHNPNNKNFLSQLGFKFYIKKLPNVNFFCQSVNIPGFSLPPVAQPNPFVNNFHSGEHITFEDLSIEFAIDEDMHNYLEVYKWIRGLGFPEDFKEYKNLNPKVVGGDGLKSDCSLIVTTSHKNPNIEFTFRDAFPISMSGINFNSTGTDVNYLTCQITFKYLLFDVERIVK